jgi:hypothetical protein
MIFLIRNSIFLLVVIFLNICLSFNLAAQQKRNLLTKNYPIQNLKQIIIPRDEWRPYPKAGEMESWNVVPEAVRNAHIIQGNKYLYTEWKHLPATVFLEYVRNGNRSNFQNLSFKRRKKLASLVMAEVFENDGRFIDEIVNGIWAICEETYWGVPAHLSLQKAGSGLPDVKEPTVDLFAAETGCLIAWTDYLIGEKLDKISPLIRERMSFEMDRRILTPNLEREDFWWMGYTRKNVNNWNPWVNSNWLSCALLMETDEDRRINAIYKSMLTLDNFINIYPDDGGCDEGPGYWSRAGASLFDCLEILQTASAGKIDIFNQALIKKMGQYIYKGYISGEYFINFADASGKMSINPAIVFRYGKSINDAKMMGFASFAAKKMNFGSTIISGNFGVFNRQLPAFFVLNELQNYPPAEPLVRDFWLPDIQVFGARSSDGSSHGFYVAGKGGHNNESHNHNDVGNFIIYYNGEPVIIDIGAATYNAKTFSRYRYEIWNMQSAFHNVPTINGVLQKNGRQYAAKNVIYEAVTSYASLSLDLASAYPEEAKVKSWIRNIKLNRSRNVVISEKYELEKWEQPFNLNFMTPLLSEVLVPGKIQLSFSQSQDSTFLFLEYDSTKLEAQIESIKLKDNRLRNSWGEEIKRIILTSKENLIADDFNIEFHN